MRLGRDLSTTGFLVGTFFFAMSLTPTLLPRTELVQGVISGFALAAGYGVGVLGQWLWAYLELATPSARARWVIQLAAAGVCTVIAVAFLWQAAAWQDSVRALMGLEPTGGVRALLVAAVALPLFGVLLVLARLFRRTFLFMSTRLQGVIPRRVSNLVGLVAAFALFWLVIDGIVFTLALRAADRSYQRVDAVMEPQIEAPADPLESGSAESLLRWDELGRQGRRFVSSGPTARELGRFSGTGEALDPLRVYVGVNSADTPQARAELALAELERVGAFERSVLLLISPTGTGWVDPGAIDTIEYLHRGDVASVAVQYSYLPSPLSLLIEGDYGTETAQAVFETVYGYWSELHEEERPALYLHGLSLGALNSDHSFELYDIIEDPFQGALWSGPPYRGDTWRSVTERREPDTPAWLPRFRDGSVVRFANQETGLDALDTEWGSFRIAFLQYASDPVTFFEPGAFYREPDWMAEPRGPDVSPALGWFPIVTGLQLLGDLAAGSAPTGYGHDYAAVDYHDAWLALTEPDGWSEGALRRLRAMHEGEQ